jgi:hypothetical protein
MKIKRQTLSQSGASAIEFALVLPVLILLLLGIVEFGTLFYDKAMITNASREGAREGIAYVWDDIDCGSLCHPTDGQIIQVVNDYLGISASGSSLLISYGSSSNVITDVERPDGDAAGGILRVNVSYNYGWLLLPNFVTDLTVGPFNLTATTEMRLE